MENFEVSTVGDRKEGHWDAGIVYVEGLSKKRSGDGEHPHVAD